MGAAVLRGANLGQALHHDLMGRSFLCGCAVS